MHLALLISLIPSLLLKFKNSCLDFLKFSFQVGGLNRHKRTHSNIKAYACHYPQCTWRFHLADSLVRHLKTHNKINPFAKRDEAVIKDKSAPLRQPKSQPPNPETGLTSMYKLGLTPSSLKEKSHPAKHLKSQPPDLPEPNILTDNVPTMPSATHAVQPGLIPYSQVNDPRDAPDLPLASQHREPKDPPPHPAQPPHVTHLPSVCTPMVSSSAQLAKGSFSNPLMSPAIFPPYFNMGHPEPS